MLASIHHGRLCNKMYRWTWHWLYVKIHIILLYPLLIDTFTFDRYSNGLSCVYSRYLPKFLKQFPGFNSAQAVCGDVCRKRRDERTCDEVTGGSARPLITAIPVGDTLSLCVAALCNSLRPSWEDYVLSSAGLKLPYIRSLEHFNQSVLHSLHNTCQHIFVVVWKAS